MKIKTHIQRRDRSIVPHIKVVIIPMKLVRNFPYECHSEDFPGNIIPYGYFQETFISSRLSMSMYESPNKNISLKHALSTFSTANGT
jgi:hypothetical protein